ncbi:MAG: hypothetical protein DMG83_06190 [Acidobacteria bacterium]|nr:MAG: hypothetical protein DMG83_06190 [Acidobacteriota bacterium]
MGKTGLECSILGMKSMGGSGELISKGAFTRSQSLSYAMSLPVATTISGMDSTEVLDQNLAILRGFKTLSADGMQILRDHGKQFDDGRYELYKSTIKYDRDPLCWLALRNPFGAGPRWSMRARIENFISLVSLPVQSTNTWRVWQRASLPGGSLPRDVLCSQANRYAPDMAGHAKIPVVEIDDCCWKSPIGLVSRRTNRPPLWSVICQTTTSGKHYPELFATDW